MLPLKESLTTGTAISSDTAWLMEQLMQLLSIGLLDTQLLLHDLFHVRLVPCVNHHVLAYVDCDYGNEPLVEVHDDDHSGDH